VWKTIRIALLLLLVLLAVALHTWLDRVATQGWHETLWVGIFPLNADGSAAAQQYIDGLTVKDFAPIEDFLAREGHRYGLTLEQPVHVELYPPGTRLPPSLASDAGPGAAGGNNIVITHELLHTAGASDKYDLASGAPLFPIGFGDRDRQPLFPQDAAEIMAGRRALSATEWEMPGSLRSVVVGPETALEIRWTH
jgi:hypothetical protein